MSLDLFFSAQWHKVSEPREGLVLAGLATMRAGQASLLLQFLCFLLALHFFLSEAACGIEALLSPLQRLSVDVKMLPRKQSKNKQPVTPGGSHTNAVDKRWVESGCLYLDRARKRTGSEL